MCKITTNFPEAAAMALNKEELLKEIDHLESELWTELKERWEVGEDKIALLKKHWPTLSVNMSFQRGGLAGGYHRLIFSVFQKVEVEEEKKEERREPPPFPSSRPGLLFDVTPSPRPIQQSRERDIKADLEEEKKKKKVKRKNKGLLSIERKAIQEKEVEALKDLYRRVRLLKHLYRVIQLL